MYVTKMVKTVLLFYNFNVVLQLLVYRKNAKLDFHNIDLEERGHFLLKGGNFHNSLKVFQLILL